MNVNRKLIIFGAGLLGLATVAGVQVALAQQKSSAINIAVVDVRLAWVNPELFGLPV